MKRLLLLALAMAGLSACYGPSAYIYTTSFKARRAVNEAKAADAEKLSPYEYWSAVEYYRMSKEKAASADWEDALKYGEKAVEMGQRAKQIADEKGQAGPNAAPPEPEATPVVVEPAGGGDADEDTPVVVEPAPDSAGEEGGQ